MADFSHLKKLEITEESTAEYVFEDIPGEPSIIFAPMTDQNPEYLNARVRIAVDRAERDQGKTRSKKRAEILSSDRLKDDRDIDRELMAKTCARGWGNPPVDVNGETPEFSPENCHDFLKAVPDWLIDPCRSFVANIYNFVDRSALITPDKAEDLGNAAPSD